MSVASSVVAASEVVNELPLPAWLYGVIALGALFALALVTYSYRNVANRHSHKRSSHSGGHH